MQNSAIINSTITEGGTINTTVTTGSTISSVLVTGGVGAPGPGVPAGGVNGQVLFKNGSTDYVTLWRQINESDVTNLTTDLNSIKSNSVIYAIALG